MFLRDLTRVLYAPRGLSAMGLFFFLTIGLGRAEECAVCRYRHSQERQQWRGSVHADADAAQGRKYAPHREVDVLHIAIEVTPDFRQRTVRGTTTIKFVPISRPLRELQLDAVRLTISGVRSDQPVADYVSTPESLIVFFKDPIPPGQERYVQIDHAAEPNQGFYFRTREMGYPEADEHVWTQGEPHEARHWFPCYDYPNEKSSTEVTCHVPQEMIVLSNGRMTHDAVDAATGMRTTTWLQEKPHVNYLICLVAGHLKHVEKRHRDVPLRFFTQPTRFEHAANSFADTEQIMAFYEQEIGVLFPWEKYDQVTIVDCYWGGMENTTLTTLTHNTLFSTETENIHSSRGLDAHEMAHQWFGDYVTCRDWSHLWLNEGFATYYTHLYEGHKFGREAMLYGLYTDARDAILPWADDRRPMVYKGYRNASEQFDFRAYPKGSWVLHMLRSQLGEDLYRRGIKTFLERHAFQSVDTEDLQEVLEEVSGRSLDRFFDQWVYHARHPDLNVSYQWLPVEQQAQITIRQTHETNDEVMLFEFPCTIRFLWNNDAHPPVDLNVEVRDRKQVFSAFLPAQPDIVRFDPELAVLAKVNFGRPDRMLLDQLTYGPDPMGRVLAVEELKRRKTGEVVQAFQRVLNEDPFYAVRLEASRALGAMQEDRALQALLASRQQPDARVRNQVVQDIARYYKPAAREALCTVVASEPNPAIVAAALRGLDQYHDEEVRRLLEQHVTRISFGDEIASAAIDSLRRHDDPRGIPVFLAALNTEVASRSTHVRANLLESLAHLARQEDDKSSVLQAIISHLNDPREMVKMAAIRALGLLKDEAARPILDALASGNEQDRPTQTAKEALRQLNQKSEFFPQEINRLRERIDDLKQQVERLREDRRVLLRREQVKAGESPIEDGQSNQPSANPTADASPVEASAPSP